MTQRRTILLWAAAGLALLVLSAALYGSARWQNLKAELGIVAFDISGLRLSMNHLAVREISIVRQPSPDERLAVTINALNLEFAKGWRVLPFSALTVKHIDAQWQPPSDGRRDSQPVAFPEPSQLERWLAWLPRHGRIESLDLTLPCNTGVCTEHGGISWKSGDNELFPARIDLRLHHQSHRVGVAVQASQRGNETHLNLELELDGIRRATMQNQFAQDAGFTRWRGTLAMSELPEAPWLLNWLSNWSDYDAQSLPELPQQMRIGAGWAMRVDTSNEADSWEALDGDLHLSANLPVPWPVVGIGHVQGLLDLSARVDKGIWLPTTLRTDLQLLPAQALIAELPVQLQPDALSLQITPLPTGSTASALPLQVRMAASGPTAVSLESLLELKLRAPYSLSFDQTRLRLNNPVLKTPDLALAGLEADLRLSGEISPDTAVIRLGKGSKLTLNALTATAGLAARQLQANVAGIGIDATYSDNQLRALTVSGKPTLSIGELQQSALRPQAWHWNGTLAANQTRVSLEGPLSNDAALALPLALTYDMADGATHLNAALPDLFLRAGNPLAATLADWPETLELNNGRLTGQTQVNVLGSGAVTATATFSARGLGGIYDRTELSGLDAELAFALQRNELRLSISELTLREANPGFTFGPLRFKGEYVSPLDTFTRGRLAWSLAEARLLGGRLWLEPGVMDLAADAQQLQAHLRGLQLPLLLEAYPAEGLTGTGVIDGNMQLQRTPAGISIEQGRLQAREPGGALQFRSAKLQALGQSNPAMRLVTEALDDFHYDVLASDVDYSAEGKLDLGLKLHGRNPALEGGRPINFSINLEEDIPALLTSLQLSDRVSETIQRRVQERLRSTR